MLKGRPSSGTCVCCMLSWNIVYRKKAFYEYFCSAGLTQFVSFHTRYDATLDLVFCNDPEIISNLTPLPHLDKSDHDIVSFSMRLPASIPPKVQSGTEVRVRNYAKCNYDLLNED